MALQQCRGYSRGQTFEVALRIYPVILCGGSGTRLWPTSRPSRPKQFLPLLGSHSLFQSTVLRMTGVAGGQDPLVVAGEAHAGLIERQLAELGIRATIMIEPEGRDSAPAVAAAAAWIAARDPHGVAAMVASDHHIPDGAAFRAAVEAAAVAAAAGAIVTFGVRPTQASSAYGYIAPGAPLPATPDIRAVERFVEKPDAATAQRYVEDGYLWNSGNFVFGAKVLLEELALYEPGLADIVALAVERAEQVGVLCRLSPDFRTAPKISIDYAVMEKTVRAAVLPVGFAWSDVGAWDAVWAASDRDAAGNAVSGDAALIDCQDSLLRVSGGPLVVGLGLRNLGVIAEDDAILVCDLGSSQGVKLAVDRLKALGRREAGSPAAADDAPSDRLRFERWLFASALPVWWALGADHLLGGFHEAIGWDGRPVAVDRRARVQARQVYVYALAGAMGWSGPWRAAVDHGLDGLMAMFRRPDGLFRTLVHADGAVADDTAVLYDQAFMLLAFATAAAALPDRSAELKERSEALLNTLRATRAHPKGGFVEVGGPTPFYANPHMHLLEAALAWEEAGGGAEWAQLADEICELCLSAFIDGQGALREWFDSEWSPASGIEGRIVEPGHQFEWAWLLERWSRLRGRADAHAAAQRLFQVGELGVDPGRGVAMAELLDDLKSVRDPVARLWGQTERLKAAVILAEAESDPGRLAALGAAAKGALDALWRYLDVEIPGLWRDKLEDNGSFRGEPAPASSLYHIICAVSEARTRGPV
jgi:mannose-1-phosphate guanylyltransferase/mannose-6-phosphate isomerase